MRRVLSALIAGACFITAPNSCLATPAENSKPELITCDITAGPFDIHRRYLSMEGPSVKKTFRVSELIAERNAVVPESAVKYKEADCAMPTQPGQCKSEDNAFPAAASHPRQLYWFKGIKVEVLDENDRPTPTSEFMCHLNLDVNPDFRHAAFPDAQFAPGIRLMTLTQGQTGLQFPDGYAIPVASDEIWTISMQAVNRTTDEHRRIKHRCTLTFLKDPNPELSPTALRWYTPYIAVNATDGPPSKKIRKEMLDCCGISSSQIAPNSKAAATFTDGANRRLAQHWVVPPGMHTYVAPVTQERDPGFGCSNEKVHLVWLHVHPLCTAASIVLHDEHGGSTPIITANCKTKVEGGLEIQDLESVTSQPGIELPRGVYELTARYDNTTGEAQDSMCTFGVFVEDKTFKRPQWCQGGTTAIGSSESGKNL